MSTADFLATIPNNPSFPKPKPSGRLERMQLWAYKHPTVVKVAKVALVVLAALLLAALPVGIPVFGATAAMIGAGIGMTLLGGAATAVSVLAFRYLNILAPPMHNMKHHTFKTGECSGGKLTYHGDVPMLELTTDDLYQAGYAHGYLVGHALQRVRRQWDTVMRYAGMPTADDVPKVVESIKERLPEEYLKEIQGLVDGFNKWAKRQWLTKIKPLTEEEVILFHLKPDSCHFDPKEEEDLGERSRIMKLGCTVVIDRDARKGITMGRNMDWPTFGTAGYTLMIKRKMKNRTVVGVGYPGFVGVLTGMNNKGLSVAMNVCGGSDSACEGSAKKKGLPALFINRLALEKCDSVAGMEGFLDKHTPLGPYHMSVSDAKEAAAFHMYQGHCPTGRKKVDATAHKVRHFTDKRPLIVTNERYDNGLPMHMSGQRKGIIKRLFTKAKEAIPPDQIKMSKIVKHALSLPYVNNSITAHRVVLYPKARRMSVAFDNAYAGDKKLHSIPREVLFN